MNRRAFTLIELSIVLVIIGLIVGGVLVGQDLIKAAKMRGLITEKERIETLINTFRLKYNGLPGDFKDAYTVFGGACGVNSNVNTNSNYCNGNNDRRVSAWEEFRFWEHLALAEMIPGSYPGYQAGAYKEVGVTHPPVPGFNKVMLRSWYRTAYAVLTINSHVITMGAEHPNSNSGTMGFITPLQAQSIDAKLDDGLPGTGRVLAGQPYLDLQSSSSSRCSRFNGPNNFYWVDYNAVTCALQFIVKY